MGSLLLLRSLGRKVNSESLRAPRDQPEEEREGEGERERESTRGEPDFKKPVGEAGLRNWSILYCPEKLFIPLVVHRDQWIIQSYAASAALTLIETRLSLCILSCIHKS